VGIHHGVRSASIKFKGSNVMPSLNDNKGKRDYTLLLKDFDRAVDDMVDHIHYGAFERVRSDGEVGYGRMNWAESMKNEAERKGFMDANVASILRHAIALSRGEVYDEDGRHHSTAISVRGSIQRMYED
jgi:hypothetical protein